jgi:hypothetical protein
MRRCEKCLGDHPAVSLGTGFGGHALDNLLLQHEVYILYLNRLVEQMEQQCMEML